MQTVTIEGDIRNATGKKDSKLLRRKELVPCVLYGGEQNIHFSAPVKEFKQLIHNPLKFKVIIKADGAEYQAILKATQFHPTKDTLEHADFQALIPGRMIVTTLPVILEGQARGVKDSGGILVPKTRKLGVKVLPEALLEKVVVNVEDLDIGKSIKVRDLNLGDMEILTSPGIPLASVEIPRSAKVAEEEEEEGEEGAEKEGAEAATGEGSKE
jgi:large subunit ribosomal protein L25